MYAHLDLLELGALLRRQDLLDLRVGLIDLGADLGADGGLYRGDPLLPRLDDLRHLRALLIGEVELAVEPLHDPLSREALSVHPEARPMTVEPHPIGNDADQE